VPLLSQSADKCTKYWQNFISSPPLLLIPLETLFQHTILFPLSSTSTIYIVYFSSVGVPKFVLKVTFQCTYRQIFITVSGVDNLYGADTWRTEARRCFYELPTDVSASVTTASQVRKIEIGCRKMLKLSIKVRFSIVESTFFAIRRDSS
jgi:hypothetical protein